MKKIIKIIFICMLVLSAVIFGAVIYVDKSLGNSYYVPEGHNPKLTSMDIVSYRPVSKSNAVAVGGEEVEDSKIYDMDISVFGIIPVKTVQVKVSEPLDVVVLGKPFGIKIYTEGALVVGFNDVITGSGAVNPAKNAGVKIGDTLVSVNGKEIGGNADVLNAVQNSKGQALEFTVKRDGKMFTIKLTPQLSSHDGIYKLGMWIRDSSAGIGTLTFYSPTLDVTAGLGHGICDVDTGDLIPLSTGEFVDAEIIDIKKSTADMTGELQGVFSGGKLADFKENNITGVYGMNCCDDIEGSVMPIALKQEITTGEAQIYTTVDVNGPKLYSCSIEKIYHNDSGKIKNMVIKITDTELLSKTGGIVQGMSGSPIIQNGKLVGAVTHVFVDDCTKGYGIFAENMLETAQSVAKEQLKEAS